MASSFIQETLPSTTHNLPMFHDGPPVHTHQLCAKCLHMQRGHQTKLSTCASCQVTLYCSKECQKAHWPAHKAECKASKAQRLAYAEKTGIPSALPDLVAWIKYYEAPLKNCAVAAMRLPENPHMERKAILCLILCYRDDTMLPVHQRFRVEEIGRRELDEMRAFPELQRSTPQFCARGEVEFGDNFYGCVRVGLHVAYGPHLYAPTAVVQQMIHFSIDKDLARANIVRQEWWLLLREYIKLGARMRFCCGRVPGMEDVCCCGGWVHDEEKRKAFLNVGK
ncbi:hypothetical protein B0H14DRAFT_2690686 [Mycena olivaceomarginata]|nr:hypothetical protein B0H14DRAFT_2690686 [Mycena olivaceomarginata]